MVKTKNVIQVIASPKEEAIFASAAEHLGLSLSAFLRMSSLEKARSITKIEVSN